ncbi:MAG: DNA replication/repair protein RecF [Gammaproteobacteria bacterium]|nr:DNA replication/repair protein RecF [Gammaproteobacteria bacterium]
MWFRRLDIYDLRNLEQVHLELGAGLNYFYGDNGAGKTAILEAVHLLARGRSFRTPQSAELVRREAEHLTVRAEVDDEHRGRQDLGLARWRRGRAELRINGEPGRKLSQAAELLPLQVMGPGLSELVFGGPAGRRQWLDWGLFHVEPQYLATLRAYLQAVRQRNAALKALAAGELPAKALAGWSEEAGRLGEAVSGRRSAYLEELTPLLLETLASLAPGLDVTLTYGPGWKAGTALRKVLGDPGPREVKSGLTQYGPHRADVDLRVADLAAGSTLSRGQGKALASAMMLAQARHLQRTARRASVFLIDDIGAELDLPHSGRFFSLLAELGAQVLATSNVPPEALPALPGPPVRAFHVEHGRVYPMDERGNRNEDTA